MSTFSTLQSGYVSLDGTDLYYEEAGQGEALVMLHAGIADRRMWDQQMDAFAHHYRTIRFDTRGYGKSGTGEHGVERVQDLHDLLRALDVGSAILMGCSQGGTTVIDFALAYPQMTSALIAVDATPSGFEFSGEMPPLMGSFFEAMQSGDLDRAAEFATRLWFDGPGRIPEQVDPAQRTVARRMIQDVLANSTMDMTGESFPDQGAAGRLHEIHVPTLIMVGEQDAPELVQVSAEMAATIPRARRVVIADTAHLPSVEKPAQFNEAVLTFLQQR